MSRTLRKFLKREGMDKSSQVLGGWLDELGGGKLETSVKKKTLHLRWVPSDAMQETPDVDPPMMPPSKI